jgi:hypothetical protein
VTTFGAHSAPNGVSAEWKGTTMLKRKLAAVVGSVALTGLFVPMAGANAEPGQGDPARGTVKIEEVPFVDRDNPNEVKVGCDFSVDFFGFDAGAVPLTFTLMPPSGNRVIARRTATVQEARGNEHSGSLLVDLSEELADVAPAQAEDFDYKARADAVVKSSNGNSQITKKAMLFIVCAPTVAGSAGGDTAPNGATNGSGQPATGEVLGTESSAGGVQEGAAVGSGPVPVGGVAAGYGGAAPQKTSVGTAAGAGLAVAVVGAACLLALRRARSAHSSRGAAHV